MKITRQDVENVALLGRLELNEQEVAAFTEQLNGILEYADVLNTVNTEGVQPTAHVLPLNNVMRKDEVHASLPREQALQNAAATEDGYIKVPKIMEG